MADPDPQGMGDDDAGRGGTEASYGSRVLDAIPDLVLVVDAKSTLRDWNRTVETATGYTGDELADRGIETLFDPDASPRVVAAIREALKAGEAHVEAELVTACGDRIPHAFAAARTRGPDGEPVLVATGRELTEEEALRDGVEESERQLRQIADHIDAAVWLAKPAAEDPWDSEILYISPRFEDIFGVPPEAMVEDPRAFLQNIDPGDAERFRREVAASGADDPSFDVEYRIRREGEIRHLRTQAFPIRDEQGRPFRLAGITRDVTELRETERRLERAQEVAEMGDWTLDVESDEIVWSPHLHDVWGIPEEAAPITYDRMLEVVHPEDRGRLEQAVQRAVDAGESYELDHRIVRPDGTLRWVHSRGKVETDPDGEAVRLWGTSQDVTEQVEAQRGIARERHRYEQLLTAAPNCIVQIDPDGAFVFANERAEEVLGLAPAEVTGRAYNDPAWEIRDLDGEPIPDEELPFRKVLDGGRAVRDERHTVTWPDGTEVALSVHGAPIFGDDGEIESTVFVIADITERLERERALGHERDRRAALFEENTDPIAELAFEEDVATIRAVNQSFRETFGSEGREVLGEPLADVLVPDEGRDEHQAMVDRILAGEDVQEEVVRETREGPRRFVGHALPLLEDGEVTAAYVWYTDVTELRETVRRLDRAQEVADIGDWSWDVGTDEVEWSPALFELYGIPPDEGPLTYEGVLEIVHPDDREAFGAAVQRAVEEARPFQLEKRIIRPDGSVRWMHSRGEPETDEEGRVVRLLGTSQDVTDLRELQEEEEFKANMLDQVGQAVLATDDEFHLTYWNAHAEEMFGYTADEALGEDAIELVVPPESLEQVERVTEALTRGEAWRGEIPLQRKDGSTFPALVSNAPVLDEGDEVTGLISACQDITELRRLQEDEAVKARLLDQVGQAVNATDAEGRITYWNKHAEEMFGAPAEEAIGENIFEFVEAHEGHREEILAHMRRGEEWTGELEVARADGSTSPAVFSKVPILDDEGDFEGMLGISYDVSDLRRLEREEALKARMLDQVGQAVVAVDTGGRVTYWNEHAEALHGYTADEALGRRIAELTGVEPEAIDDALERGEESNREVRLQHRAGTRFPAVLSVSPIRDDDGDVEGAISVAADVSDLKETEREVVAVANQLRSRNRELQELSQAAAHGLRTPAGDVVRYLQRLEDEAGDKLDESERRHLETALDGGRRMDEIVNGLQAYLDAATRPPSPGPTDAREALDDAIASLADGIEAAGARIEVEEPAPELGVDHTPLAEVFGHLIDNALSFAGDEPPRIEIGFEREDDMWVVSVADHGVGMEARHQERVFRPFRTLHTRAEGAGPGLGLALCRAVVEAHGGVIWARSRPGEGTTVSMTLPAPGAEPGASRAVEADASAGELLDE